MTHSVVYLRMPAALKRRIVRAARKHGLSINEYVTRCFVAELLRQDLRPE